MRFHVLGVGSIGTLISHHLRLNNPKAQITLITRGNQQHSSAPLRRSPPSIIVEDTEQTTTSTNYDIEYINFGDRSIHRFRGDRLPPIDSLIVCLKTRSTVDELSHYKSRLSPTSVITLLQNGMGVFDELCHTVWPEERTRPHFILGTTTHGVTSFHGQNGYVRHLTAPGEGDIKWGVVPDPRTEFDLDKWLWNSPASKTPILSPPPSPQLPLPDPPSTPTSLQPLHETLTALLSLSNLTPTLIPMPHLHHQLLLKLALNSIINPLTAILGAGALPNGGLLDSIPANRLIRTLSQETSEIITAYLHSLASPHTPPPDVLRLFTGETLENRVIHLIRSTSQNRSSMASDVVQGRPTEIGHINGYLISLGRRLGVPTPNHALLVDMVKFTVEVNAPHGSLYGRLQDRRDEVVSGGVNLGLLGVGAGGGTRISKRRLVVEAKRLEIEERKIAAQQDLLAEKKSERRLLQRRSKKMSFGKATGKRLGMSDGKREDDQGKGGGDGGDGGGGGGGDMGGARLPAPGKMSSRPDMVDTSKPVPMTMDQLIASAPRHERTWEVPTAPPTARGPLPKKREEKTKADTPALSFTDMMTQAISAAPRQITKAIESMNPLVQSPVSPLSVIAKAVISPLDHLIASSPRAERTWDVHGGTVTTLGLTSGQSFANSFTTSTSPSTLGMTMNDLIAGAPRMERTWPADRGEVPIQGLKGRFITSRTSGS